MNKFLTALLFIGEWILFLWLLLMIFLLNLVNLFHLVFTDMPFEEATLLTSSSLKTWLLLLSICLIISFFLIVRIGRDFYRWVMRIVWVSLLGWSTINSLFWYLYSNSWSLSDNDRMVLLSMFIVSLSLTLLAIYQLIGQREITKTVV